MIKENFKENELLRANTIRTYTSIYNKWIKDIPTAEVKKNMMKANLSTRTMLAILRVLKKERPEEYVLERCDYLAKYLSQNSSLSTPVALCKEDVIKVISVCKKTNPDFYPILLLALHAGLRRGEIFGLTWNDVDFLRNNIYIKRSYNGPTKNGKHRKVPMSPELEKCLLKRYNLTEEKSNRIFKVINPNPLLEDICRRANVQRITFHQLRHTFATMALDSGMSPKQVQTLLGHSKVTTTLDLYWQNTYEKIDLTFLPS